MVFNVIFQQYFSYIVVVSVIGGGNQSVWRKPPTCSMLWDERWLFVFVYFGGIVDHHFLNFFSQSGGIFNYKKINCEHFNSDINLNKIKCLLDFFLPIK